MEVKQEPNDFFNEEQQFETEKQFLPNETATEIWNSEKDNNPISCVIKPEFVSVKQEYDADVKTDYSQQTCIKRESEINQNFDVADMSNLDQTNDIKQSRIDFALPKKVTELPRRSQQVNEVRKQVAKTGAERIREYRARIRAYISKQNLKDNQIDLRENPSSLLHEACGRHSTEGQEDEDNHRQDLLLLTDAPSTGTQNVTKMKRYSKIAKTPAERARAYRQRKKALKNASNEQRLMDTTEDITQSNDDYKIVLEDLSPETTLSERSKTSAECASTYTGPRHLCKECRQKLQFG